MATWKHINTLPKADIIKIVGEDFKWSEKMREEINQANLINLKTFHAIDLDRALDSPPILSRDNNNMAAAMFGAQESTSGNTFYPPFARGLILAYWALISMSLFPQNENWLHILANEGFDDKGAEAFQQIARYLYREIDYPSEAEMAILQALNMDISLLYTGWKVEPGVVQVIDEEYIKIWSDEADDYVATNDKQKVMKFEYKPKAISLPDFWSVNTFNVRHDPDAGHGDLDKSNPLFIGITMKMNKAQFHRRVEAGMFSECEWVGTKKGGYLKIGGKRIPDDEPCGGDKGDTTFDYQQMVDRDNKLKTSDDEEQVIEGSSANNHYRLSLYWQNYSHVIVMNDKYNAHKQQTLGYPFQKLVSYPIQGRFSGRPVMTDLIQIQHDITTMVRSRRDRQDEQAYAIKLVDETAFQSADEARAVFDGDDEVKVYNSNSRNPDIKTPPVEIIERKTTFDDTVREQELEKDFGHWVTGFDEALGGGPTSGVRETATKTMATSQGGAIRTGWIIKRFAKQVIVRPTFQLYPLAQKFMTKERRFRVAGLRGGVDYVAYQAKDFLLRTPPEIRAITELQKDDMMADAQIFMNALTMITQNPAMAQLVKASPNAHELYRRMGVDNTDEFLHSDKPVDVFVTPHFEIQMLIYSIEIPVMNRVNPEEHYEAIAEFINSEKFDQLEPEAQRRVSERGMVYKQIMDQGGQMQPGMAAPGGMPPQVAGGMAAGMPTTSPVEGAVNRMGGGTSPMQVASGGA